MNSSTQNDVVVDCSATTSVKPDTASVLPRTIIIVSKGNHTKFTFYDGDKVENLHANEKPSWIPPNQRHPPKRTKDDSWVKNVSDHLKTLPKGSSLVSFEYTFEGIEDILGVSLDGFVKISLKEFFCQKMTHQRTSDEKLSRGKMAEMLGINPCDFEKNYPKASPDETAKLYYAIYVKLCEK
jgi:hypothetical protein